MFEDVDLWFQPSLLRNLDKLVCREFDLFVQSMQVKYTIVLDWLQPSWTMRLAFILYHCPTLGRDVTIELFNK